jgi:2-polyprenyl-3-methyl-5-hydroxy-6-metoxy-1,4-benzoquinol methylase
MTAMNEVGGGRTERTDGADGANRANETYDAVQALPDADVKADLRMSEVKDWREALRNPGSYRWRTEYVCDRFGWEWFYAQHPLAFFPLLGAAASRPVVLDLGCGEAFGVENWVERCASYHGVDLSAEQLAIAAKHLGRFPNVRLYRGPVNTPYLPREFADVVISSEVIEHLDDPQGHLEYCRERIRPGGLLSLSTPCASIYCYPSSILGTLWKPWKMAQRFRLIHCHKYWSVVLADHPALRPGVLRAMIEKAGLKVVRHVSRCWYIGSRIRFSIRASRGLERLGCTWQLGALERLVRFYEKILARQIPALQWAGTRQFILARKA